MSDARSRERKARDWLRKNFGYAIRKSRSHSPSVDDLCGYMVIDAATNSIVAGERYNLDLDDVEAFIQEHRAAAKGQEVD